MIPREWETRAWLTRSERREGRKEVKMERASEGGREGGREWGVIIHALLRVYGALRVASVPVGPAHDMMTVIFDRFYNFLVFDMKLIF